MQKITCKAARVNRGLTQREVGELIGKSRQTINSWENGHTSPGIPELKMLCSIYDVSEDDLIMPKILPKT